MSYSQRLLALTEAVIERLREVCRLLITLPILVLIGLISPLIGVLLAVAILRQMLRTQIATSGTHGTASWAGVPDLLSAGCLFQNSGIVIGRVANSQPVDRRTVTTALLSYPMHRSHEAVALAVAGRKGAPKHNRSLPLYVPERLPHIAIFGSSGSGKSTCYAVPQLLRCTDSMVVLDPKGELARTTARHRAKRLKQDIVVIDPFNVAGDTGFERAGFNPLSLFRDEPTRIVDEARRLASALVVTTGEEKDPFWSQASTTLITTVLSFLMADAKSEDANLNTMRDLLTNPEMMEQMLTHMQQSTSCGGLLRRLAGQVCQLRGQTKASVYAVANSHVDFLDSLAVAETLAQTTFDPQRLINGRQTIYLCIPVDRLAELAGLQRVMLSTLINLVFAAGEDPGRRVRFQLDEAATLGAMDSLYNAVQFGRSFGLRLTFLFQSVSQVTRCFPESQKDDFFATVGSVFCGINDQNTAKEISEWIGRTTVFARTDQSGSNTGRSSSVGMMDHSEGRNYGTSDSTSYAETGRDLIQSSEVLQLPSRSAIVLLPNVRPILAEKTPWYEASPVRPVKRVGTAVGSLLCIVGTVLFTAAVGWIVTDGSTHPVVAEIRHEVQSAVGTR